MGSDDAEEEVATVGVAAKTTETRLDKPERESKPRLANAPDFGPRYRVTAVLGRGGMGEVFRAYDADLREEVALKVVRTDQAELDAHGRFRREIALARKVTDPNVLRVYDLGDYQGLRYLSMELVDGESLAAILRKEKLDLERALAIFRQVCKGLVAAHAQGVVHRDLKPQNVLVDKHGRVRVADFGLARSIGDSGLTASGAILGSPAYMSPEQVKGDPADERSDIYSLGVMLYQLCAGAAPFKADTPHALMEMRLHKKPRALREVAPHAPQHVEAIVARCLEIDPAKRYRSVSELLEDLERGAPVQTAATMRPQRERRARVLLPATAGVLALAGVIAYVAWPTSQPAKKPAVAAGGAASNPASEAKQTIVLVMAIENRTGDAVFDSSLDMVLEQALRRSRKLEAIVGTRLQQLGAEFVPAVPIDQLGRKVAERDGARVLVMRGYLTTKGQGFTVALTTVDAESNAVVSSGTADARTPDEVIGATARLAVDLRKAIGEKVEDRAEDPGLSSSIDAVHDFALGLGAIRSANNEGARQYLESAVRRDPSFARAQGGLAIAYHNLNRPEDGNRAYEAALRTIDRMSDRDRLKFLGDYHNHSTGQLEKSIAAFEELLAQWPNDLAAQINFGVALEKAHQITRALEVSRRSAQRYPRLPHARANLVVAELRAGNFEAAIAEARKTIADFPKPDPDVHLYEAVARALVDASTAHDKYATYAGLSRSNGDAALADFALAQGRLDDADQLLRDGLARDGSATVTTAELKHLMQAELALRRGDKAGARAAAAKVMREADYRFYAALVQLGAGDEKRALQTAKQLAAELGNDSRAYAKLIEAESLRRKGTPREAVLRASEAIAISNVWHGQLLLAQAALDAGQLADAFTTFQKCHARRGEIAVDPKDHAGARYAVTTSYWLARTKEALGSPDAAASYRAFLATQVGGDPKDTLIADANARLAKLKPTEP